MAADKSLNSWQQEVDQWLRRRGTYWQPLSQFVRLVEEVGELGRELNHRFGDKPRASKDEPGSVSEELGDILFIVLLLANTLDVDLEAAMVSVLAKYDARSGPLT
ncbi:MAG TPA: nucleotide pyrophosphohydrolase [Candidatus Limnocylindria bacterium]|nr:nucleotide pyrophosphohydrolase [Candidatus Limnocylindria bacterium]